jgi:hypothetical protein
VLSEDAAEEAPVGSERPVHPIRRHDTTASTAKTSERERPRYPGTLISPPESQQP